MFFLFLYCFIFFDISSILCVKDSNIISAIDGFLEEQKGDINDPKPLGKCGIRETEVGNYAKYIALKLKSEECAMTCSDAIIDSFVAADGIERFKIMYNILTCCSDMPGGGIRKLVHLSIMSCEDKSGNFYDMLIPNHYDNNFELHSEILGLCYSWNYFRDRKCTIISQAKPCPWCQRAANTAGAIIDSEYTFTIFPMKNSCVWSSTFQVSDNLRKYIIEQHQADHQLIGSQESGLESHNRKICNAAFNFKPLKRDCLVQTDAEVDDGSFNKIFSAEECTAIDQGDYLGKGNYLINHNKEALARIGKDREKHIISMAELGMGKYY